MKLFKNLLNSIHVTWTTSFDINPNVIDVDNNKNIKFFYQSFVDIALKASGGD